MNKSILSFILLVILSIQLYGQEDRKWALGYTGGVLINPVITHNPSGISIGRGSESFKLTGELYLPKKWGIQAGYFRTNIDYGDADRTMEGLQLGVKKYFVNPDFFIQPYVSAATQVNWSQRLEYENFEYEGYKQLQQTRNPRLSFAPGTGVDFFLFSSVALVVEYSFNMGIHSKTSMEVQRVGLPPYTMKDKGMYHQLELGVRATFPFKFTNEDGQNFVIMLISQLVDNWLSGR